MTEREQLWKAICADPENDTIRLAFADWLDEQPKPRLKCKNEKCHDGRLYTGKDGMKWIDCPHCGPDASDADLAEFIRVQCRLSSGRYDKFTMTGGIEKIRDEAVVEDLLELHGDRWRRAECPGCNGHGEKHFVDGADVPFTCPTCGGSGDLFRQRRRWVQEDPDYGEQHREDVVNREVKFFNGFPYSVTCRLGELGVELPIHSSPWARAVVETTPVVRFVLTDATIFPSGGNDTYYVGNLGVFPREFWRDLERHPSERTARDTLALVAGRVVRESVYGKKVAT